MAFVFPSTKIMFASFCALMFIYIAPQFIFKKLASIDGGYGQWSSWSSCLKHCGDSVEGRIRNCTNPRPSGFGSDCIKIGPNIQTRLCKLRECAIDGQFGSWADWTECDKPCKDGKRKRTRKCDKPKASNGGMTCKGNFEETQPCMHLKPCPIDGLFSNWGQFTPCSVTCGPGHKTRLRECNNPPPQFGGKNCVGNLQDLVDCKDKDCEIKAAVKPATVKPK